MYRLKHVLTAFFLIGLAGSLIGQPIWLSNKIPVDERKNIRPIGMHHLASISEGRRKVKLVQWLMIGEGVETSAYYTPVDVNIESLVFAPSGKRVEQKLDSLNQRTILTFSNREEGFYNAYIIVRKVSGDTLYYSIAKSELLNHSCRNGHAHVREMLPFKEYPAFIPLEIVRERMTYENFHYYVASGEEITYKVLLNGTPSEGVKMKLSTEKGWVNSKNTDKSGLVNFQFLQDYFTKWQELNNRKEYTYVLFANTTVSEQGVFNGQSYNFIRYTASISDAYRPAKTFYQSMFWSIIVLLLTTISVVIGVTIYRRRHSKPYKELVFNEKD